MPYTVTIVTQEGEETEVATNLASSSVKQKDDGALYVCVSWHLVDLYRDEPETVEVLKGLWPGEDRLILSLDESDVFWGNVSKVAYKDYCFYVEATSDAAPGPDDLVLQVDNDEQEPMAVRVIVDNKGHGPVSVDFGDGSDPVDTVADGNEELLHTYNTEGRWVITATDKNEPSRYRVAVVTVPAGS